MAADGEGEYVVAALGAGVYRLLVEAGGFRPFAQDGVRIETRVSVRLVVRLVDRWAARLSGPVSSVLGLPGIPAAAHFPTTLPTVQIVGYAQLGSPANTASSFSTSVTDVADSLLWVRGRHVVKTGFDSTTARRPSSWRRGRP